MVNAHFWFLKRFWVGLALYWNPTPFLPRTSEKFNISLCLFFWLPMRNWSSEDWLCIICHTFSIPASSDTVESEGRQMKQCWMKYIKKQKFLFTLFQSDFHRVSFNALGFLLRQNLTPRSILQFFMLWRKISRYFTFKIPSPSYIHIPPRISPGRGGSD